VSADARADLANGIDQQRRRLTRLAAEGGEILGGAALAKNGFVPTQERHSDEAIESDPLPASGRARGIATGAGV
jgi:hypothetical protein